MWPTRSPRRRKMRPQLTTCRKRHKLVEQQGSLARRQAMHACSFPSSALSLRSSACPTAHCSGLNRLSGAAHSWRHRKARRVHDEDLVERPSSSSARTAWPPPATMPLRWCGLGRAESHSAGTAQHFGSATHIVGYRALVRESATCVKIQRDRGAATYETVYNPDTCL